MYDKSKKTWSQRLKITKTDKNIPITHQQQLFDYSQSALSRSMKYAEPFLYGTVRGIPAARPGHQVNGSAGPLFTPLATELAVVVCSCPEYLNGTKREIKKASICKKCKGSRLPLAPIGGTVRLCSTTTPILQTLRASAGTMRLPSSKSRPSIINSQNDPYDLMRRTRLLSPEPTGSKSIKLNEKFNSNKSRAKSTSPTRGRSRHRINLVPSNKFISSEERTDSFKKTTQNIPAKVKTYQTSTIKSIRSCSGGRKDNWSDIGPTLTKVDPPEPGGRRSILHCDVNPYDLISTNNEFSPISKDDDFINAVNVSSYKDLLDDDNDDNENDGIGKINYRNIQEIAGQRISLGETSNSILASSIVMQNTNLVQYENESIANNFMEQNDHLHNKSDDAISNHNNDNIDGKKKETNRNVMQPMRPPRRKLESPSSSTYDNNDVDNFTMNNIEDFELKKCNNTKQIYADDKKKRIKSNNNKMLNNSSNDKNDIIKTPQKDLFPNITTLNISANNNIKSILKRPSSVTSTSSDTELKQISLDNKNVYQDSQGKLNNKSIHLTNLQHDYEKVFINKNFKNDIELKQNDKKISSSQFYLPLPQTRKKVQFMVEDKIIENDSKIYDINNDNKNAINSSESVIPLTKNFLNNNNIYMKVDEEVNTNVNDDYDEFNIDANSNINLCHTTKNINDENNSDNSLQLQEHQKIQNEIIEQLIQSSSTSHTINEDNSKNDNIKNNITITTNGNIMGENNNKNGHYNVENSMMKKPFYSLSEQNENSNNNHSFATDTEIISQNDLTKTQSNKNETKICKQQDEQNLIISDNPRSNSTTITIRRTHSDRHCNIKTLNTNVILNFNDTMALRMKSNHRTSTRELFSHRPKEPPPPPPPPKSLIPKIKINSNLNEECYADSKINDDNNIENDNKIASKISNNNKNNTNVAKNDNNIEKLTKNNEFIYDVRNKPQYNKQNEQEKPLRPPRQSATIKSLDSEIISWQNKNNSNKKNYNNNNNNFNSNTNHIIKNSILEKYDQKENKNVSYENEEFQSISNNNNNTNSVISSNNKIRLDNNNHLNKNEFLTHQNQNNNNNNNLKQENENHKKFIQAQNEISNGARLFGINNNNINQNNSDKQQKTVVRVAPFNKITPEIIHRLKINHSDESSDTNSNTSSDGYIKNDFGQKKTSILINGDDDCYSTVNASNDTPIYQSSVFVTDGITTKSILSEPSSTTMVRKYLESNENQIFDSDKNSNANHTSTSFNTVTINVYNNNSSKLRTFEEEIIYKNNKINTLLNSITNNNSGLNTVPTSSNKSITPITEFSLNTTTTNNFKIDNDFIYNNNKKLENNLIKNQDNNDDDLNETTLNKRNKTLIKLHFDKPIITKHNNNLSTNSEINSIDTNNSKNNILIKNHNIVSHEEELVKILRNPVEAVRRNLIPHVCGKNDVNINDDIDNKIVNAVDMNETAEKCNNSYEQEQREQQQQQQQQQHPQQHHHHQILNKSNINKYEKNSFVGKLLEDPTLNQLADGLDSEVVVNLIENSLKRLKDSRNLIDTSGTKDNDDITKLIDQSLEKIKEERIKMEKNLITIPTSNSNPLDNSYFNKKLSSTVASNMSKSIDEQESQSNRGSISSGNSYSSANYELFEFDNSNESDCYQSCSSEITTGDEDSSTRSKFYQMLVDATLSEIEITANDDHHYESIRMNGDPIYEEISEIPPPLPLSPPPNDMDNNINMDKKSTRSMFEGASKYDILSYLVDAKERAYVREDEFSFSNTNNGSIVEEEIDQLSELRKKQNQSNNLDVCSSRLSHLSITSDSSEDFSLTHSLNDKLTNIPNHQRKSCQIDIERNDSGVGSETSKSSRSKYQSSINEIANNRNNDLIVVNPININSNPIHLCEDCDGSVETQVTDAGIMFIPLVCRKCGKKRAERKEIITEIVETEEKYGRDLQIILEEFCQPMLVAGLLTQEQLSAIFLNTEELLENNQALAEKMRDALDIALEQGDDDLLSINVGRIFLESTQMLHAFESYCVRQAAASLLLANLEKEKELLRIFLRVSQMENTVLRRMNLNSFLMVPVQRVTKYPLLLARLYKVTPTHLDGRDQLKQAQEKIELHLNHMNEEAKDVPTKLWRRISSSSPNRRASCEIDMINIKLRKMAIDILEWNHDEVRFTMEGKLLFTQPTDGNWKKGRTIKLTPVNALLVTNGKPSTNYKIEKALSMDQLNFPRHTGIREASLLLVKEKCGRYTLIREPLYLDRCVVCTEADWDDYFEMHEISSKDTFIFKAEDSIRTKQWYRQLQYHAQGMGAWRKRRNALANIMINGMLSRT